MKRIILATMLLSLMAANSITIRCLSQARYDKEINGNSGFEITLLRGTIKLNDEFDFKFGLSEQYTGHRSRPFSFNHFGNRFDYGFNWKLPLTKGLRAGYTHSIRTLFDGASPVDLYDSDSVDTFYVRYEFDLEILGE